MKALLPYPIHPVSQIPELIVQGEDPWYAVKCFLHDWWCFAVTHRQELIQTPPPVGQTLTQQRWAAFCAAMVEELCNRVAFPHPSWIFQPEYILSRRWVINPYTSAGTLEPFTRRNIIISKTVLDNKYEYAAGHQKRLWTAEEMEQLEKSIQAAPHATAEERSSS
ncbi:hypothetical protein EI42_03100 [Thermosporothrix hazakensis]|jgi:hypothetical protein|uniref:Uncharacterized protein n=2 Tax=Thermosporothrix TaxID=768650 RepID=A0A326U8Z5_THEHA|nr:hypothetical protein [Thermosporothrix hazakensis]PZW28346.1 hypothetical protein EI42_03100 [Thermosporothrix hazakensis]BBH85273.1 hypothetical protein KTC_00240 [Thermosporothrix sp. COM3]GCE46295.1 hypothetical protein KTH_11640 [Thermosporothrix hazakensis]